MRLCLLIFFVLFFSISRAQNHAVHTLPEGRYETVEKQSQNKWAKGDIILLDESRYKITSHEDIGEYRFSETAQRIFFISGPLKAVFAKTATHDNKPVIIIPIVENERQGFKLAPADVWAYFKK